MHSSFRTEVISIPDSELSVLGGEVGREEQAEHPGHREPLNKVLGGTMEGQQCILTTYCVQGARQL